jgi:hypothetical protein
MTSLSKYSTLFSSLFHQDPEGKLRTQESKYITGRPRIRWSDHNKEDVKRTRSVWSQIQEDRLSRVETVLLFNNQQHGNSNKR